MENNDIFDNASLKDGFAGDRRFLKGFLAKIELVFLLYPDRYQEDEAKVIYIISRLYGNAMNWAASLIEQNDPCLHNYDNFKEKLKTFYGSADFAYTANQMLRNLKQLHLGGIRGYILEFNRYADESTWNEQAKMNAFIAGLHQQVALKVLEIFPGPRNLLALQTIASRIDSRLFANKQFFGGFSNSSKVNTKVSNKNISKHSKNNKKFYGPLSYDEKERRRKNNLCLYCGSPDHNLESCPKRNNKTKHSTSLMSVPSKTYRKRQVKIMREQRIKENSLPEQTVMEFNLSVDYQTDILVDSGSKFNLIDKRYCSDYHIPFYDDGKLPKIMGIGGTQSIIGTTPPLTLRYKDHICQTCFYVTDLPTYSCLLGSDWLRVHNPSINFNTNELFFKSDFCKINCHTLHPSYSDPSNKTTFTNYFSSAFVPTNTSSTSLTLMVSESSESNSVSNELSTSPLHSSIINEESEKIVTLPKVLSLFKDVFSEASANILPPHRPYDCQINLIDNAKLYYGPIYPLNDEETTALKEYIQENLKKGFIRKSKSPAGAPILFVRKKNGKLRLCVDYRQLNSVTIRDSYPLPLIQDMLEHLGKSKIFSKLDLRSAYNLVRIKCGDEYKTAFTCKFGHFEYLVMPFGLKNARQFFSTSLMMCLKIFLEFTFILILTISLYFLLIIDPTSSMSRRS